ncbi:MAG: AmmeMemoRadiSam system protein B [Candidatus Omnitrophica bacterium]|nr:AmmeMemoRadiSam system protein B [Candidatus Omnitrophota bacterium]MDD5661133.1 AmmeMemoRadiSam system protein B [Candidatus Omnitrophota bacterium]
MCKKIISNFVFIFVFWLYAICFASIKEPDFAGKFYPASKEELSRMIDGFLEKAEPVPAGGEVLMLISPHAGYGYSGPTAAFGYKLIRNKPYKTVIVLGTSHHKAFNGAAVYGQGSFLTSLGRISIDEEFVKSITEGNPEIFLDESAFKNEHSVEVQLPFLQKVLPNSYLPDKTGSTGNYRWKIVPVIIGDCSLETCKHISGLLKNAIGERRDVLLVVSTDMYHGYDFKEAEKIDTFTLGLIEKMAYEELYYALRDGKASACGGFASVIALSLAKDIGCNKVEVLNQTNSALVTGNLTKGDWTVGYLSCAIAYPKGENMLNNQQKKELLKIARDSIATYLKTGKKLQVSQSDPLLNQKTGSFVTLNMHGNLRGCIGNLIGNAPLYLTVRDMAVEAAVGDLRFSALSLSELEETEIEISVLSALNRVVSADDIKLGMHGVLVRKGVHSGVFLPQVATETGWSKEEFLNNLCAHKAGLPADAWRDKNTELYVFTAEVFSEKEQGE